MRPRRSGPGALLLAALVIGPALGAAQAGLARVGASEADAERAFGQAMIGLASPGAASRPFLALTPASRASVVTEVVAWAKTYVASPAFARTWADMRAHAKPAAPALSASADADLKQQAADAQKQIDDVRKSLATLPADQQKAMQPVLDQLVAQLTAQQNDPKYQALMRQSAEGNRANQQQQYQDALAAWQRDYPADPGQVVARRLRAFLTMSADVTFDAPLVSHGPVQVFADPTLEAKSAAWKLCFRAGREATAAARAAAQAWLTALRQ